MSVSLAELDYRVISAFPELPESWLDLKEVHNAVVQRAAFRTNQARQADTNVLLSVTDEFRASPAHPVDLTGIIDGQECFVEMREGISFRPVKTVAYLALDDARSAGEIACAFFGEEANGTFTKYLQFSITPIGSVRIRYDANSVDKAFESVLAVMPDALAELIVFEAQNYLIPRLKLKAVMGSKKLLDMGIAPRDFAGALDALYSQNALLIREYASSYGVSIYRDRGAQSTFNRRVPSGKGFYGR